MSSSQVAGTAYALSNRVTLLQSAVGSHPYFCNHDESSVQTQNDVSSNKAIFDILSNLEDRVNMLILSTSVDSDVWKFIDTYDRVSSLFEHRYPTCDNNIKNPPPLPETSSMILDHNALATVILSYQSSIHECVDRYNSLLELREFIDKIDSSSVSSANISLPSVRLPHLVHRSSVNTANHELEHCLLKYDAIVNTASTTFFKLNQLLTEWENATDKRQSS